MYFNSTELWRTSTAEPTQDGIFYTYKKEMHQYLPLWKEPQKIIFDLGNIVNSEYTGILNTTLTATFFTIPDTPAAADKILPISRLLGASNSSSVAVLPGEDTAVSYTLPRNLKRAVISVSACGQADEEFWYQNVFSSDTDTFVDVSPVLYGDGPWREVQVLIDGMLAGVSWPFPVIFTGGMYPYPLHNRGTAKLEQASFLGFGNRLLVLMHSIYVNMRLILHVSGLFLHLNKETDLIHVSFHSVSLRWKASHF